MGVELVRSRSTRDRVAGLTEPGALSIDEIRLYVFQQHRHAPDPPAGGTWGYAIYNGPPSDPVYDGPPRFSQRAMCECGHKAQAHAKPKGAKRRLACASCDCATFQSVGQWPLNLVSWPPTLIGVTLVGTPIARKTAEKGRTGGDKIADVTRVAMNHAGLPPFLTYKAASMVYNQAAADAKEAGYDVIQTFTLEGESGMSLRYTKPKWKPVKGHQSKGGQWDREDRPRTIREGELAQSKTKWELRLT